MPLSYLSVRGDAKNESYGEMPMDYLYNKMEQTDMTDDDGCYEDEDEIIDYYSRSILKDRTCEAPSLESDMPRRNGTAATFCLNTRYNGSRGELNDPMHPELNLNDMTPDNIMAGTSGPDYRKMREFGDARVRFKTFGKNDDHGIAEGEVQGHTVYQRYQKVNEKFKQNFKNYATSKDYMPRSMPVNSQGNDSAVNKSDVEYAYGEFVTDLALIPHKNTITLSNDNRQNLGMYNLSTTDHEFNVGGYNDVLFEGNNYGLVQTNKFIRTVLGDENIEMDYTEEDPNCIKKAGLLMKCAAKISNPDHIYGDSSSHVRQKNSAMKINIEKILANIIRPDHKISAITFENMSNKSSHSRFKPKNMQGKNTSTDAFMHDEGLSKATKTSTVMWGGSNSGLSDMLDRTLEYHVPSADMQNIIRKSTNKIQTDRINFENMHVDRDYDSTKVKQYKQSSIKNTNTQHRLYSSYDADNSESDPFMQLKQSHKTYQNDIYSADHSQMDIENNKVAFDIKSRVARSDPMMYRTRTDRETNTSEYIDI